MADDVSHQYDGFLSYSRQDREKAERLRGALQQVRRPILRRRSLDIALDTEVMSPAPALRQTVQDHLDKSKMLIVALSPAAAESDWVNEEVSYWLTTRSVDSILLAWLDGDPVSTETGRSYRCHRHSSPSTTMCRCGSTSGTTKTTTSPSGPRLRASPRRFTG